jgi:long-chain acyl-CoA synthetase
MEQRIWHNVYPQGVLPGQDYEKMTLPDVLARTAATYPNNVALILMGKKITYRRLDEYVNMFASALSELGIGKGDKVALILPNIPQIVIATYAIWRLGAVVVMNNPLYTERELEHQLNDSESKMAIAMDLIVPRILSLKSKTGIREVISCHIRDFLPFPLKQIFPFVKKELHRKTEPSEGVLDFWDVLSSGSPEPPQTEVAFDDLAALMYTGGTTGVSKGVMLTHAAISINVQQLRCWLWNAEEGRETVIGVLPFFHAAGFTAGMNHCIYRGFTHVLMPKPDVDLLARYIRKYRPAIFGCVPTLYVGLLNNPNLPSKSELAFIKGCISGAAPLAVETIREWDERVGAPICETYGMTEMAPVSHANPWAGKTKPGSVGVPFPDTDCRIVDVETGEKEMAVGESGEILLKGPQQMKGYFNCLDETADSLKDGWFSTGDIGYMDEEGYLFIVDRKKDMVIAGGFNIYPREIDEVLYEHPKIQDACAVGLPDPYRGETVKAYIVLKDGQTMTEEEVVAYCREKLTPYKVPKSIEFMDDLPKSAIGKIMRRELRDMELARSKEQP